MHGKKGGREGGRRIQRKRETAEMSFHSARGLALKERTPVALLASEVLQRVVGIPESELKRFS